MVTRVDSAFTSREPCSRGQSRRAGVVEGESVRRMEERRMRSPSEPVKVGKVNGMKCLWSSSFWEQRSNRCGYRTSQRCPIHQGYPTAGERPGSSFTLD
jgi:hypothetical protein